jgi:hypothetical protein
MVHTVPHRRKHIGKYSEGANLCAYAIWSCLDLNRCTSQTREIVASACTLVFTGFMRRPQLTVAWVMICDGSAGRLTQQRFDLHGGSNTTSSNGRLHTQATQKRLKSDPRLPMRASAPTHQNNGFSSAHIWQKRSPVGSDLH